MATEGAGEPLGTLVLADLHFIGSVGTYIVEAVASRWPQQRSVPSTLPAVSSGLAYIWVEEGLPLPEPSTLFIIRETVRVIVYIT